MSLGSSADQYSKRLYNEQTVETIRSATSIVIQAIPLGKTIDSSRTELVVAAQDYLIRMFKLMPRV